MTPEPTEQQSDEQRQQSQRMSITGTGPPADVPGYEPHRFIGSGAYGEVWAAVDKTTGRMVAIKFYTNRTAVDWSLLSREVEKLVFLSADRYVVQLLDVGWEAEPAYFVMEYVENGSLEDHLRHHKHLSVGDAVEIFREVAIGLTHAHGKGILHCDLKPANVLLDQDTRPRLADFGQSRLTHEQDPSLGTLFYMAPEQADLEAMPDARWDVYALGALLYNMLTGEPPYRTEQLLSSLDTTAGLEERLALYREMRPPTEHRQVPGVDRALADIIDRCLTPSVNRRFANIQEVVDALKRRELARVRRPLIVLGFLGPALLLLIMTLFAWRGYSRAIGESEKGVTATAGESNAFAAQLASGMVAQELDRHYRAVETVVADEGFREQLVSLIDKPEFSSLLSQAADTSADESVRQAIRDHVARQPLQQSVEQLLDADENRHVASWFVTDANGVQVASVFASAQSKDTVGRYYGYRTYFHGGLVDLAPGERPGDGAHVKSTHLSAVILSTATNTLKVALSAPIYRSSGTFAGIVALTVEVGRFVEDFEGNEEQFAVLVDDREGEYRGAILQHPLFDTLLDKGKDLPSLKEYSVDLGDPRDGSVRPLTRYEDPLGQHPDGGMYDRRWIAAKSAVSLRRDNLDSDSGLVVVVQEDYNAAIAPVYQLGERLFREGLIALGVVIGVVVLLGYFVAKTFGDPAGMAMRHYVQRSDSTTIESMATLPARPGDRGQQESP